ncbi:MAG: hypothetical protein ISS18_16475, partial [Bacteroidales bacterium]|nr:hypothetical protein [Bacteroidales bacterium]
MKNVNFLSIFLVAVLFATNVNAQFSRQQANDLVLNDVLSDDVGKIDVFSSFNSVTASVDLIDNDNVTNPYAEAWVFFSDDSPFASWYHGSRVIFVSTINGDYTINDLQIYPKGLSSDYEEISSADRPDPVVMDGTSFQPDPEKVLSNYNYALIVVSMDNPRNWYNTSLIYNVLIQNYNYQEQNIFVLYSWDGNSAATPNYNDLDGDGNYDDIDGEATWDNIQSTIAQLTTDLGHGDQLAVFFTGVPVNTALVEPRFAFPVNEYFSALYPVSGISEPMEDIDCGQMLLTFDVNSSSDVSWYFEADNGTDVLCENRYLHGPTGSNEENYAEMYFSGGNYSEQLFYWASAARGYLPDVFAQEPWNIWEEFGELGLENGGGDYETYIPNHPGDNELDDDLDSFIQMGEAFEYADDMNTWTAAYCYLPYNDVPLVAPQQTDEIPFAEDLLTLAGLSGYIENTQNMPSRSYIMADNLYLNSGISLAFDNNTEFYLNMNNNEGSGDFVFSEKFEPESESGYPVFYCYENSNLSFGTNSYLKNNPDLSALGYIVFFGHSVQIGSGSSFDNVQLSTMPTSYELSLTNVTFKNISIGFFANSNNQIESCALDSSLFWIPGRDTEISNCNFTNSSCWVFTFNQGSNYLEVDECDFSGDCPVFYWNVPLNIKDYSDFNILNTTITDCNFGISIQFSGWGRAHNFNNIEVGNVDEMGISAFSSRINIDSSYIHNCGANGLFLNNHCSIDLTGNPGAHYVHETQRIMDNDEEEVYTDDSSFPVPFIWNAVIDDDPHVFNTLVYCKEPVYTEKDVRYNYWGNNFDPEVNFFPPEVYIWEPTFDLIYEEEEKSDAQVLYETAQEKFESEDFTGAKSDFQQVIGQYPDTRYAQ